MNRLKLIATRIYPHVSLDIVLEFENCVSLLDTVDRVSGLRTIWPLRFWIRVVRNFGFILRCLPKENIDVAPILSIGYLSKNHLIYKTFPYLCLPKSGTRFLWAYDIWPGEEKNFKDSLEKTEIDVAFVSSKYTAEQLSQDNTLSSKVVWLPEAIDSSRYKNDEYTNRKIDVIAIGRRHATYHQRIMDSREQFGYTYVYQENPKKVIFPTWSALRDGLASSKISVCFPRSLTHPDSAGGNETMTWRYLQSISSGCLIVGKAPAEMIELFGYDPVVPVDWKYPGEQLNEILQNFDAFNALINKNLDTVLRDHQWSNRMRKIFSYM